MLGDFVIRHALRRAPDFLVGGKENPYMKRWWLIPRNKWFNIYLHQFMRDDDDRALHDHPWWGPSTVKPNGFWFPIRTREDMTRFMPPL